MIELKGVIIRHRIDWRWVDWHMIFWYIVEWLRAIWDKVYCPVIFILI